MPELMVRREAGLHGDLARVKVVFTRRKGWLWRGRVEGTDGGCESLLTVVDRLRSPLLLYAARGIAVDGRKEETEGRRDEESTGRKEEGIEGERDGGKKKKG